MFKFSRPLSISIKLWLAMTLLILTVLGGLGATITWLFGGFYLQQQLDGLKIQATNTASELAPLTTWLDRFNAIQGMKLESGTQLVLLDSSGAALAVMGTAYPPGAPGGAGWGSGLMWGRSMKPTDFFSTSNLLEVLAGNTLSIKAVPANGRGQAMLIAAAPIGHNPVTGVVLFGSSPVPVQQSINTFRHLILYASLLAVFLATIVSLFLARQVTRPLAVMQKAASRMAEGEFSPIEGISSRDEMGELASALNSMSQSLSDHVAWLSQEKNLLEGIVAGISEAVIMLGVTGELLYANDPARELWQDNDQEVPQRKEEILTFLRQLIMEKMRNLAITAELTEAESFEEPVQIPDGKGTVAIGVIPLEESGPDQMEIPASAVAFDRAETSCEDGFSGLEANSVSTLTLGTQILQVGMASLAESGGVRGHVIVLRDVTASMRAEKERRDFLASVTHELRTPLHLIQGYLEAIQDGVIPKEEEAENINLVLDESKRLARLVHSLQDINRMEREQTLQLSTLKLRDFMQELYQRFQGKAYDLGVNLEIYPLEGEIVADRDRLLQVFINLLDNALQHTPSGKTVKADVELLPGLVRFRVRDEGEGVPPEALNYIFERFFRVDKARSRKEGGMGLGLAIVKQIVEAHGGRVQVESQLGLGSTFSVDIPQPRDRQVRYSEAGN